MSTNFIVSTRKTTQYHFSMKPHSNKHRRMKECVASFRLRFNRHTWGITLVCKHSSRIAKPLRRRAKRPTHSNSPLAHVRPMQPYDFIIITPHCATNTCEAFSREKNLCLSHFRSHLSRTCEREYNTLSHYDDLISHTQLGGLISL